MTNTDPIEELKQAYTAWLELPSGLTDEEAGPVYTRWLDAYDAAYQALSGAELRAILQECKDELGMDI